MTPIAAIIDALKTKLEGSYQRMAVACVEATVNEHGANDPDIEDRILDDLDQGLAFPTEACAVVRGVLRANAQ